MDLTHVYVPLVKAEKQSDGTLKVSGPITSSALDRDLQVCDPDWLDRAVPAWFGEGGNVREMHQPIAAGKAMSYWKAEDGKHWVEALVVDPGSVSKVEHGVLTGFSIGIKGARVIKSEVAPNGAIVDGAIIETSLVDRPANPECLLELAKSDEAGAIAPVETQVLVEQPVVVDVPAEVVELEAAVDTPEEAAPEVPSAVELAPVEVAPLMAASQEVRTQASAVLEALTSLGFPTVKADAATDIASAQDAIAAIARLVQSEAESLAAGELGEAGDIEILLCAIDALRWFIASESMEEEKADRPDPAPVVAPSPEPVIIDSKADTPDQGDAPAEALTLVKVEAMIAEALTKVTQAHEAETSSLRAELAKVKAEPVPGGPVRVPTQVQKGLALDHDSRLLLKAAQDYEERAAATTDRTLAEGYRRLAEQERQKALR